MKQILFFIIMLTVININAQGTNRRPKFQDMERALNGSGNPVANSTIFSDVNGKFRIKTLAQAKSILGLASSYTSGSILFAHTDGSITQDNANLFYNNTTNKVGINKNSNLHGILDIKSDNSNPGLSISNVGNSVDFFHVYNTSGFKILGIEVGDPGGGLHGWQFNNYQVSGTEKHTPFFIDDNATDLGLVLFSEGWQGAYYASSPEFTDARNFAGFNTDGSLIKYALKGDAFPDNPVNGDKFYYTNPDTGGPVGAYTYTTYWDPVQEVDYSYWLSDDLQWQDFFTDTLHLHVGGGVYMVQEKNDNTMRRFNANSLILKYEISYGEHGGHSANILLWDIECGDLASSIVEDDNPFGGYTNKTFEPINCVTDCDRYTLVMDDYVYTAGGAPITIRNNINQIRARVYYRTIGE